MPTDSIHKPHHISHEHASGDVICISDLNFSYDGKTPVLEDIRLHVEVGSSVAIAGPNGAGKTTLIKIMLGLETGFSGHVEIAGLPPVKARRAGDIIGWVPQRSDVNWSFPVCVRQVAEMGLTGKTGLLKSHRREDRDYVSWILNKLEISDLADRAIGKISGGQQQRAIIARALAPKPKVLILDEPQVGVDAAGQQRFRELIERIKNEFGVTMLIVSHDLQTVILTCEKIACLNRVMHFHDAPDKLTHDMLSNVFHCNLDGILPETCEHHGHHHHE